MAVYIREDGTGDYTSLSAAITANETDIEIHGSWLSHEDSRNTIDDANTTIEAFGASRQVGYLPINPTNYRMRPENSGDAIEVEANGVELIGLDLRRNPGSNANSAVRLNGVETPIIRDCILSNAGIGFAGLINISSPLSSTTVTIENCTIINSSYKGIIVAINTYITFTININSCTIYGSTGDGIYVTHSADTVNVNVYNSICVGNGSADFYDTGSGTCNWDIHYSIDSDGSINTEDSGAVGCLTNCNPTDDDTKSSDGDWVIFRNITNFPFDMRLAYNDYNEAIEMHSSNSGAGLTIPDYDLIKKPREISFSCGAYQMPWIVEEGGNYDYTSLSAAVSAPKRNIEIWGSWSSAENSTNTLTGTQSEWFIEAIGEAKHPGYRSSSPTHFRLERDGGNHIYITSALEVKIKGLDFNKSGTSSSVYIINIFDSGQSSDRTSFIKDCLITNTGSGGSIRGLYCAAQNGYDRTPTIENCIFSEFEYGIYINNLNGSSVVNAYINSCTIYDCNYGIVANAGTGAVNINIFNTISVGSGTLDFDSASGSPTWDIHYCIDSDGSINTEDSGAVGCLTNMNPTDDCTKTSDGDWVIFNDITTSPYDLRLCANAYNEARNFHSISEHVTDVMQMPGVDIAGRFRKPSFNAGAFETPAIVREINTGDYTTLAAAITANETDIEIDGPWTSIEESYNTIDTDYTHIITVGQARHPGFELTSPTYHRFYCTPGSAQDIFDLEANNIVIDGLWVESNTAFSIHHFMSDNVDKTPITIRNCIILARGNVTYGIRIKRNTSGTYELNLENCIIQTEFSSNVGIYGFSGDSSTTLNVNVNSCTIYDWFKGVYMQFVSGALNCNVFNTICIGNTSDFSEAGTPTWDINCCIDGDGSISSMDSGAMVCLENMNETDDCTKSSDGDWVIFNEDSAATKCDLRLCKNDYNEAIGLHSYGRVYPFNIPQEDIEGNPRIAPYDCGAYEFPSGEVCWGHDNVFELNIRDFIHRITAGSNYVVKDTGNNERVYIGLGGYIELETWNLGAMLCRITDDKYQTGKGSPTIKYKDGSTKTACEADSWNTYSTPFACSGWIKLRVEA